jgi:hypothetical protein
MKNILLWAGIAVLAFQDYFKKQPVKPTRRQQFLQTGETSQAFIEGTNIYSYTSIKKKLIYYFGKPDRDFKRSDSEWNIELTNGIITILLLSKSKISLKPKIVLHYNPYDREAFMIKHQREIPYYKQNFVIGDYDLYKRFFQSFLYYCVEATDSKDYEKLLDIAKTGDWELALEIAKGQGMI